MCAHRWTTTANAISPGLETETRDEVVQLVEGSVEREQHCASSRYLMFTIFEAITRLLTNSAFGLNNTSLWLREKKKKEQHPLRYFRCDICDKAVDEARVSPTSIFLTQNKCAHRRHCRSLRRTSDCRRA